MPAEPPIASSKLRSVLLHALALLIVLVATVALAELLVRIYTSLFQSYDMEMSRYARQLKVVAPDPRIGHLHRPLSHARLMGVDVAINSDGFRDREYPVARSPARRLIFLGDSLTFGWGVSQPATFEALLEDQLAHTTEIINFGTGNYNTEQEVQLFLSKGLKYHPDGVVVFYFINDAEPTPHQSSWERIAALQSAVFFWSRVKTVMSRLDAHRSFAGYYNDLYLDDQPGWIAEQKAFLDLKRVTAAEGIALRVVLLPELHALAPYLFAAVHRKVGDFLTASGIEYLDAAPCFAEMTPPAALWVAPDDAHPNARAHAMIAACARDFVDRIGRQ